MIALKQLLVATDFSAASDTALAYGRELARTFDATLHVLHVTKNLLLRPIVADPEISKAAASRTLNERLTADDRNRLHAHAVLETSDRPAEAIVAYARMAKIDLVVIGTRGHGAVSQRLVGSVAERVVRTAPCPVLTVRGPEHECVHPSPLNRTGCRSGIH